MRLVTSLIAFVILAAVIFFLVVKPMNALKEMTAKKVDEKPTEAPPVPDDVKLLAPDVLRHRLILTFEAQAEAITTDVIIQQILKRVEVP